MNNFSFKYNLLSRISMNTTLLHENKALLMVLQLSGALEQSFGSFYNTLEGYHLSMPQMRAMLNLAFVMGFVGVAVGLMIAMFIFGAVDNAIVCSDINSTTGQTNCNLVKSTSWTVLGILPITLFFVLFSIFGGFNRG